MHLEKPGRPEQGIDHDQRRNAMILHDPDRFCGKGFCLNGAAPGRHDVIDCQLSDVTMAIDRSSQVTIGIDAYKTVMFVGYTGKSVALACHFNQRFAEQCIALNDRQFITGMHQILHPKQQAFAQRAARVGQGKILGAEASRFQQGDRGDHGFAAAAAAEMAWIVSEGLMPGALGKVEESPVQIRRLPCSRKS